MKKIDSKTLTIKVENGGWYALRDGKRLTAKETATLIAKGIPYRFEARQ